MCNTNCSGGCPSCAPDEHYDICVEGYDGTNGCICDQLDEIIIRLGGEPRQAVISNDT